MTAVIKAIGILLLQIIIYYLFGTMFELFCRKNMALFLRKSVDFWYIRFCFKSVRFR